MVKDREPVPFLLREIGIRETRHGRLHNALEVSSQEIVKASGICLKLSVDCGPVRRSIVWVAGCSSCTCRQSPCHEELNRDSH